MKIITEDGKATVSERKGFRPTGLYFVFANPSAPLPPRFSLGALSSRKKAKSFLTAWLKTLCSICGRSPGEGQGTNASVPGYNVCFTIEQVHQEEIRWAKLGLTTFQVFFTLDEGVLKGTLSQAEQNALKFFVKMARGIDGESEAGEAIREFKGQDFYRLLLKGIKAERIWRTWLESGRKGFRRVKAA